MNGHRASKLIVADGGSVWAIVMDDPAFFRPHRVLHQGKHCLGLEPQPGLCVAGFGDLHPNKRTCGSNRIRYVRAVTSEEPTLP